MKGQIGVLFMLIVVIVFGAVIFYFINAGAADVAASLAPRFVLP